MFSANPAEPNRQYRHSKMMSDDGMSSLVPVFSLWFVFEGHHASELHNLSPNRDLKH